jgi:signal transduction histidine kinase
MIGVELVAGAPSLAGLARPLASPLLGLGASPGPGLGLPLASLALALTAAALVCVVVYGWWARRALRERAARVAHEVRQPLSAAQLALHGAARRGEIAPTLVAALELELRRAARALDEPAVARPADVDLHALLACQVRTWHDVAAAHGASLALEHGAGTLVVHADALRLAQAFGNVVANAIEHGGGAIVVRTCHVGDRIRVEVADGGPGLPASIAELARRPRAGRGTRGRGLAIAGSVLAHCGGHVATLPAGVAIDLPAARGAVGGQRGRGPRRPAVAAGGASPVAIATQPPRRPAARSAQRGT